MGKLKDTMLMKTQSTFLNKPGWGISFMIDGHKFHAMEGSDLCDLVRSIIMDSIVAIKTSIDIRGYQESIIYTRTNEPNVKRERGTSIFSQDNLFEAVQKEIKNPYKSPLSKKLVGETKFKEMKKEEKPILEASVNPVKVNIMNELNKLPNVKVEVVREVVKKPSIVKELLKEEKKPVVNIREKLEEHTKKIETKISISPEQLVILRQYQDKLNELKVEKLSRNDVRKFKIRTESPLFNGSYAKFIEIYNEWKKTLVEEKKPINVSLVGIEEVFKQYENKLLELNTDKLKRDDARKYHINYNKFTNGNYGIFLEMFQNWKSGK